jgi:hypothetical protein
MHVAVMYEGVMVSSAGAPILDGIDLVKALAAVCRVTILSEAPEEKVRRTCDIYNTAGFYDVVSGADRPVSLAERDSLVVRQVKQLVATEGRVDTVIISDPLDVPELSKMRISVVLFMATRFMNPEFLPAEARSRVAWEEIEAAAEARRPKP